MQIIQSTKHSASRTKALVFALLFIHGLQWNHCGFIFADDYVLTIGGGYSPSGNQASLEANVMFFQSILKEQGTGLRVHETYFSDGSDSGADVQFFSPAVQSEQTAVELIESLHQRGRRSRQDFEYRNHKIPNVSGPTDPALIHTSLSGIAQKARIGDRLIIYVTSHGSAGKGDDPYNTTIDCWNGKAITVREFVGWLNEFDPDVPLVMVMAQCYCGGFARTIFEDFKVADDSKILAKQLRTGFFAQQHNLMAAGCRPDIDNDEEFSSYFWGAIIGRSRKGDPIFGCDLDGNGKVSFAEAHAYAIIASNTIDVPLRASDVLLRTYSRIGGSDTNPVSKPSIDEQSGAVVVEGEDLPPKSQLRELNVTLENLLDQQSPVLRRIVTELSKSLGLSLQDNVTSIVVRYDEIRNQRRPTGRGSRRRSGSGRRDLLDEIAKKWPELADEQNWRTSPLLLPENQKQLLAEVQQLPSFERFKQRQSERVELDQRSLQNELKEVKFRRLIGALEVIVLSKNLPLVAPQSIVQRYRDMIALEESSLIP